MKSIMEEASTVVKAISKAWEHAQKPVNFSVKVLEEPQTNFFGMTVKPAKIALFFASVEPSNPQSPVVKKAYETPVANKNKPAAPKKVEVKKEPRVVKETYPDRQPDVQAARPTFVKNVWTDEMVDFAKTWLQTILEAKKSLHAPFEMTVDNNKLLITFLKPIADDVIAEQSAFNSLGHLITKTIRTRFRGVSQGLRISIRNSNDSAV